MPRKRKEPEKPRRKLKEAETEGVAKATEANPEAEAVEVEVIPPPSRPVRSGRPSKRTPEIELAIFDCLRLGMTIPQTCDACGVSQTQFRSWRKHYRAFQELCRRAEAEAVKFNLSVIQAAAGRSWQAAAWFLERKYPEQWGRTETLSLSMKKEAIREAVVATATGERTPAQLKELRQILQLPKDADGETVEAAIQHAKEQDTGRKIAAVMGVPFTPKPFQEPPPKSVFGLSEEALATVEKHMLGTAPPTRAERIAALIELHAKARELAGKPPLSKAEAFETAARELDNPGE